MDSESLVDLFHNEIKHAIDWIVPAHLPYYFGFLEWNVDLDEFVSKEDFAMEQESLRHLRTRVSTINVDQEVTCIPRVEYYHWNWRAPFSVISYWTNIVGIKTITEKHCFGFGYETDMEYVAWNAFVYQFYSTRRYVLYI